MDNIFGLPLCKIDQTMDTLLSKTSPKQLFEELLECGMETIMSKADKMIENLGYRKYMDRFENIVYANKYKEKIIFDTKYKKVIAEDVEHYGLALSMQELQAINEKCKELRLGIGD